jgi:putative transposase
MGLARSTYYDEPQAQPIEEARLVERIKAICAEWPSYGYRRVTAELHATGWVVNHKKVMRLMKEQELTVRPRRRFVATTDSDHDGPIFPNLAKDVVPTGPNQLWVADITYIAIAAGFVYLAAILDAWSRRVVGYAIGRRVMRGLRSPRSKRPSPAGGRRGTASTTPIAARNTLPKTTGPSSRRTASRGRWAAAAILTTTPRRRAS